MSAALRISEIFHSIQGESTWAGCPCIFVRTAGCHLRCAYCDTEYSFKNGENKSLDEIIRAVAQFRTRLVEITGGEPLLQKTVHELVTRLCDLNYTVLIETSGACDISSCDPRAIRIMDLKTPGSGEQENNLLANLAHLNAKDEVKFVITSREDYLWARAMVRTHSLAEKVKAVLFSPVFEQRPGLEIAGCEALSPHDLAQWLLEDGFGGPACEPGPSGERMATGVIRMQLQLHKFIWEPSTRGV